VAAASRHFLRCLSASSATNPTDTNMAQLGPSQQLLHGHQTKRSSSLSALPSPGSCGMGCPSCSTAPCTAAAAATVSVRQDRLVQVHTSHRCCNSSRTAHLGYSALLATTATCGLSMHRFVPTCQQGLLFTSSVLSTRPAVLVHLSICRS